MAENLSAVQNVVELRISDTSSESRIPGSVAPVAKLALAVLGCAALASCASGTNTYSQKPAPVVVAAITPPPSGTPTVIATPPVRNKNGTDKPYVVGGKRYVPASDSKYTAVGLASWYGSDFHGRKTADGERFDMMGLSAAHKTMPLPSYARVTNMSNGASIVVRVNDRGPYVQGRLIDLSSRAADLLQFKSSGVGKVKVEYVGRAPETAGDTKMLMATLRTDGTPAPLPGSIGGIANTMVADATPPTLPTVAPIPPAPSVKPDALIASANLGKPSLIATPDLKPVVVPPVVAQAEPIVDPAQVPAPQQVAGLTVAFTPLPPTRPRSSDGILGKAPPMESVGQVNLAKAKIPLPPEQPTLTVQPSAQAFAAAPAPAAANPLLLVPTPAVNASMVPGQ